ncbi:MAG TPA: YqgE/AlgH family protein [Acidimicrobiales bacterium]|nr:YqgE/AlgH family protein [Acidimicrobiales bacterium]
MVRHPSQWGAGRPAADLTGRLLVASTRLGDSNFEGTVTLLLDHGPEGALGVVLNQPTPVPVGEILAPWQEEAERVPPGVVFRGGPVSPDAVIGLARAAAPVEDALGWRSVMASVGTVDLAVGPEAQPVVLAGARLFSGYAGWAPDQLESELGERAWFVLEALESDVFCTDADRLWHDVLRRQGGELSLLAAYPKHPTLN